MPKRRNNNSPVQSKLFPEDYSSRRGSTSPSDRDLLEGENKCTFCTILSDPERTKREIVFQDQVSAAMLDRSPLFLGHTLLIPTNHYETIFDPPGDVSHQLFKNAQLVGKAVKLAMRADGLFVAINNTVSQSVPHLHIHLVPRKFGDGLKEFFWPRQKYVSEEEKKEIADSIRASVIKIFEGATAS